MFPSDTDRSLRSPSLPCYAPDIFFFQSDSEKVEKESVSTQNSASFEPSGGIRFNLNIPRPEFLKLRLCLKKFPYLTCLTALITEPADNQKSLAPKSLAIPIPDKD